MSPINFKRVNLGLMAGVDLVSVDASLSSIPKGSDQKDFTAPVLGANRTIQPIDKLAFYVGASGLSADVGRVDAHIFDAIARVEYYLQPWFALTGGYRLFDFDVIETH